PAESESGRGDLPGDMHSLGHVDRSVPILALSALTGEGIDLLRACVLQQLGWHADTAESALIVANARHAALLSEAQTHLEAVLCGYYVKSPADAQAGGLAAAVDALGQITGELVTEDLLATIFSRFCI